VPDGGEVDEQVVRQTLGRLVVGLVGLPHDPADEPHEPDQRARQLTGVRRPAPLLAHRLLEAGDDLRPAGEDDGIRRRLARAAARLVTGRAGRHAPGPELLLPPARQGQRAAQHLHERQLGGDVRAVVGQRDRRRIGRRVVGLEQRLRELGGRRRVVGLEQQVDRGAGLAP